MFFSYSVSYWLLVVNTSYFLIAYIFIFPNSWSEQKIATLASISSITAVISFLNPWRFVATALGINKNEKDEWDYSLMTILKIMTVIFIIVSVVALYALSEMYSSIARMSDH